MVWEAELAAHGILKLDRLLLLLLRRGNQSLCGFRFSLGHLDLLLELCLHLGLVLLLRRSFSFCFLFVILCLLNGRDLGVELGFRVGNLLGSRSLFHRSLHLGHFLGDLFIRCGGMFGVIFRLLLRCHLVVEKLS